MKEKLLQVRDKAIEFYKNHEEACEIAAIVTVDVIQVGLALYLGAIVGDEFGFSRGYKKGYKNGYFDGESTTIAKDFIYEQKKALLDSILDAGESGKVFTHFDTIDGVKVDTDYIFKAIRK